LNHLIRSALIATAAVALPTFATAADITDPAELFPPGTLAYAELHDPATVGPQVAAVFKGTALEDSIAFIQKRRDAAKDPRDLVAKDQLAVLGLLASPEMAAEVRKLRGVAVGVTGFTAQGDPQAAVAVLTGEGHAAGLAARALLTLTTLRKVAAVGDVPVYQFRQPQFGYDPNGRQTLQNNKPPTEGPHEMTFAYVPGLIVLGTSKAAVGEVVTRFQGKAKGALAGVPAFKEAAAAHRKPGLFFYANAPEFCAKYDDARRKSNGPIEPDALGWFRLVANTKAIRSVSGCLAFRDGGLSLTVGGSFDPVLKSPLAAFLSGPGAKVELLRGLPTPATFAVAVALPEKDRARAVIDLLDAAAKANGELGRLPSDAVKELGAKYKVVIADELIGKTRAVAVVLPVKQELPKGASALPLIVLHTDSPNVAVAWEDFLPKLLGDLAGAEPAQPSSEVIGGVKVLSLPGTGLPWKAAVHYARKDATFVIGLDRKLVAATAAGEGSPPAASLPPGQPPVLLGTLSLGGLARAATETTRPQGPVVPLGPVGPATTPPVRRGFIEDGPGASGPGTEDQKKAESKAWDTLLAAIDKLPAATVTARRTGNELRFEVWQPKVQGGGFVPVINAGVDWFDKTLNRATNPNVGYGRTRFGRFR
jgi:hypothetical protein